ncbi:TAP-like protein-domain-containing protein [Cladochytrium replicatum]|nr:TAP-like protein-domain-containing protein [Cladochytrium replicatum]
MSNGESTTPLVSGRRAEPAVNMALRKINNFTSHPPTRRIALVSLLLLVGLLPFTFPPTSESPSSPLPSTGKLQWKQCGPDGLVCSKFVVPLDHLNASNTRTIALWVIKLPATTRTSLGPLFINPGGPGASGVNDVRDRGKLIQGIVRGRYDIVSWDPRGVGESEPIKCFGTAFEQKMFNAYGGASGSPPTKGVDPMKNYAAYSELLAKMCEKYSGDLLKYISTASVARDLDALREAFGQEVTNYWGFSYGTVLGATYVNMFPERVGRVILDGVVDPIDFTGDIIESYVGSMLHTDDVIEGFGYECEKAGPSRCPLANYTDRQPGYVLRQIKDTVEALKWDPIVYVDKEAGYGVMSGDDLASILFSASDDPSVWPELASALADLMYDSNVTSLAKRWKRKDEESCPAKIVSREARYGVTCTDANSKPEHLTLEGFLKDVEEASSVSWIAGYSWLIENYICSVWPVRAAERYAGPWNKTLNNKIMLIGNTLDPEAPLESAQLLEDIMEGNAVLLTQVGYGHCSYAQKSKCTDEAVYEYLVNGQLPELRKRCEVDGSVFPEIASRI